jgi:hypothetical protein
MRPRSSGLTSLSGCGFCDPARLDRRSGRTLPGRLELPTLRLTASRSNQLSYGSQWDQRLFGRFRVSLVFFPEGVRCLARCLTNAASPAEQTLEGKLASLLASRRRAWAAMGCWPSGGDEPGRQWELQQVAGSRQQVEDGEQQAALPRRRFHTEAKSFRQADFLADRSRKSFSGSAFSLSWLRGSKRAGRASE